MDISGAASILSAVGKLGGDKTSVKKRNEGLEDLRRILNQLRNSSSILPLRESDYHQIFEILFRIVCADKAKHGTSAAASRLSSAATALRLIVEVSKGSLKHKTVISVLDHIVDTLPSGTAGYCAPIQADYVRIFRQLLEHAPHAEHLRPKQWQAYVDFVIQGIYVGMQHDDTNDDSDDSSQARSISRQNSTFSRTARSMSIRVSQSSRRRSKPASSNRHVEDLLASLYCLVNVPHAPRAPNLVTICDTMLTWIETAQNAHEYAFATLNCLLPIALSESMELVSTIIYRSSGPIQRLWTQQSGAQIRTLRDQMLITLYYTRYGYMNKSVDLVAAETAILDSLVASMWSDIEQRKDRDSLYLDDLDFTAYAGSVPMALQGISPSSSNPRVATAWTTLYVLALLVLALGTKRSVSQQYGDAEGPRKRQRLENSIEDVVQRACNSAGQSRLTALQLLVFVTGQMATIQPHTLEQICRLEICLSDDDASIVSWTYILLARVAQADEAQSPNLRDFWLTTWLTASRAQANTSHCRAACYLMNCMLVRGIIKPILTDQSVIDTIFADGGEGPPLFTDTVIELLVQLVGSGYLSTEQHVKQVSRCALRWLEKHWSISSVPDRIHNAALALHGQPRVLCSLLLVISGQNRPSKLIDPPILSGEIYRAAYIDQQDLAFARYLLGDSASSTEPAATFDISPNTSLPKQSFISHTEILSALTTKTLDIYQIWISLAAERILNVSNDIAEIATTACILLLFFAAESTTLHLPDLNSHSVPDLWKEISAFCSRKTGATNQLFLAQIAQRLMQVRPMDSDAAKVFFARRREMINDILHLVAGATESQDPSDWVEDSMPTDASQSTHSLNLKVDMEGTRHDRPIPETPAVIFAHTLVLLRQETLRTNTTTLSLSEVSTLVIDEIIDMDDTMLILSRSLIEKPFEDGLLVSITDTCRLLSRLAVVCLRESHFARCEAALCFCLNIMSRLAPVWVAVMDAEVDADGVDGNNLADIAFEISDYYLNVVLKKNIASNRVLLSISRLMDSILKCNPSYFNIDLPSPRTTLLTILEQGQNSLRFEIVNRIARLFDGYVLSEHAVIFTDIVSTLPSDPDMKEAIAVRLHVLAYLGARWHTVLRQAVYHIFETASKVAAVTGLAKRCLQSMCTYLDLESPQALFRCFASQILYTWLEEESVESISFSAFGYNELSKLIYDNKDEFTAQIAMRESMVEAQKMVRYVGSSWDALVQESFPRALAYALIADITIHRSSQQFGKSETFLITHIGDDGFAALLGERLPEVLGVIFSRMTDDRGFEKGNGHPTAPTAILESFEEMCSYSSSAAIFPASQQPSFRAKYLISVLNRLCDQTGTELDQLWNSATVISVCRVLLDDAKKTYGPLHACAILRKLRVLISLAAEVAQSGYCLEMLLHNLRPFLTQFNCSLDAIGIFRYLLEHGKRSLLSNPSFLAGLGVSVSISMSKAVKVSRDSTTQESQYAATITKAQEFQTWLRNYLNGLGVPDASTASSSSFTEIIRAATQVTKCGSNSKSSAEGNLLYHLLVDQSKIRPVLSKVFFRLILRSFCNQFTISNDASDDIVREERDTIALAPVLQSVMFEFEAPKSFRIWAATTIGRAYVLQGPEQTLLVDEAAERGDMDMLNLQAQQSYRFVIEDLTNQLWSDDRMIASAAEHTLQTIFSSIAGDDKLQMSNYLPDRLLCEQLSFTHFRRRQFQSVKNDSRQMKPLASFEKEGACNKWASCLASDLCLKSTKDPILTSLVYVLDANPDLAARLLPSIVHIVLLSEFDSKSVVRDMLSATLSRIFGADGQFLKAHAALGLDIILYLRRCCVPSESTMAQRNVWLALDFQMAAEAAARCKLYDTALLLLEIYDSQQRLQNRRASRHSSQADGNLRKDLVTQVFHGVDDPDFFYSTIQETDVASIVAKLCHEGDGHKAVSFQSALLDSEIRTDGLNSLSQQSSSTTAATLSLANFHGLAQVLNESTASLGSKLVPKSEVSNSLSSQRSNHRRLEEPSNDSSYVASALQILHKASDVPMILDNVNQRLLSTVDRLNVHTKRPPDHGQVLITLAVLSELKDIMHVTDSNELAKLLVAREEIRAWYLSNSFESIEHLLVGRETTLAGLKNNKELQTALKLSHKQSLLYEVKTLRTSLNLGNEHAMSQFCLNRAVYLSKLTTQTEQVGLKVNAAIQYDLANTLWTQNETSESIILLQNLRSRSNLEEETIALSQSEVLTNLGQKLTQARLDRPDEVTAQYLQPAIEALGKQTTGSNAGRVFHNFAVFCDQQLHDADYLDEYSRIDKLRNRKKHEVETLEAMKKGKEGKERDVIRSHLLKAQTWFKLDEQEWHRLKKHREDLVSDCLENYLRAMQACNDFPNDVLRFLALWLDQSVNEEANKTVSKYLPTVPSIKFAPLVNQLSSRILDTTDPFHRQLFELLFRVSNDHPYHSLYQIFATSKSKGQKGDTVATSRYKAATKLAETVMKKGSASAIWISIHNSNIAFVRIATDQVPDKESKTGSKIQLRKFAMGPKLEQTFHDLHHKIPPPTLKIPLRVDKDYKSVPTLASFDPSITIAGGVSAPKIISANASDGSKNKMLLKGGNDDLRQDSIMEQVFEQVSNLLGDHRKTRQRKLGIRTYKVIPLTHNAGIIEFVKDTMPLHDYILPAHTRYYPKDYKPNRCRKEISDAQTKSLNQRLQAYLVVCANFHPVMRFFFMEHFPNPDEWFQKRLNYSRSTAAISMLGHVLGLGDRHGHNILLDTNTGEVVHIDLGVAFEAGRVLPIPEVVPFRLTRDLVDGMGLSGVEGVFRRCCRFTLEALRQDQEAIITILDVLRWDPLYSWSISPLRLQRMQENEKQAANSEAVVGGANDAGMPNGTGLGSVGKNEMGEPGEADRALAVVAKKLGKSLSVEATVNELIRQATDEKNLAVLYCGWAAYA